MSVSHDPVQYNIMKIWFTLTYGYLASHCDQSKEPLCYWAICLCWLCKHCHLSLRRTKPPPLYLCPWSFMKATLKFHVILPKYNAVNFYPLLLVDSLQKMYFTWSHEQWSSSQQHRHVTERKNGRSPSWLCRGTLTEAPLSLWSEKQIVYLSECVILIQKINSSYLCKILAQAVS